VSARTTKIGPPKLRRTSRDYRDIDREEVPPGNPIDLVVHRRVRRPRKDPRLANAARDVLGTGVASRVRVEAALPVAWAMLGCGRVRA